MLLTQELYQSYNFSDFINNFEVVSDKYYLILKILKSKFGNSISYDDLVIDNIEYLTSTVTTIKKFVDQSIALEYYISGGYLYINFGKISLSEFKNKYSTSILKLDHGSKVILTNKISTNTTLYFQYIAYPESLKVSTSVRDLVPGSFNPITKRIEYLLNSSDYEITIYNPGITIANLEFTEITPEYDPTEDPKLVDENGKIRNELLNIAGDNKLGIVKINDDSKLNIDPSGCISINDNLILDGGSAQT